MMLCDCKHDGFAGTDCLFRSLLLVGLPSESIELLHHKSVCLLVSPLPLKLSWVVVLLIKISALGDNFGDAGCKPIGNKVAVLEGFGDRIGEVRYTIPTLIE